MIGAIGIAKKAASDATGQANTKALSQFPKKSGVRPKFIHVTNPVMIKAMMAAITTGLTYFGDTLTRNTPLTIPIEPKACVLEYRIALFNGQHVLASEGDGLLPIRTGLD